MALVVYAYHLDRDVLLQLYHRARVGDKLVGQLGDVDEPILMDANVDEGAKLGDVGHYSRKYHPFLQVVYRLDRSIKLKVLQCHTWVSSGLLELCQNVVQRGQSHRVAHIALRLYLLLYLLVLNQFGNAAFEVFRHLLHDVIALGMHRAVVERILGAVDA